MKRHILSPGAIGTAGALAAGQAQASIGDTIDGFFAASTGWFVDLIFATLPTSGLIGVDLPWIVGWLVIDAETGLYLVNEAGRIATVGDVAAGVPLTSAAFGRAFGWAPYALSLAVFLFAFSTMIAWSYYGMKSWTYLFGEGKTTEMVFKVIFCVFVFIGAVSSLGAVLDFSDAALFAMAILNIIGLYFLIPIVKRELNSYMARLQSGEIRRFR